MIPLLTAALLIASNAVTPLAPPVNFDAARTSLDAYQHEPSIRRVQRLAVAYAGLDPLVLRGLRARARLAAVVPDLRFKIARVVDDGGRAGTEFDELGAAHEVSATETRERRLRFEGELRWFPSEVVFRHEETKLVRESRHAAHERIQLLETVTRVYFDRRRAQLALTTAHGPDHVARVSMMLEVQQLTAELDALTGGVFSRLVAKGARP